MKRSIFEKAVLFFCILIVCNIQKTLAQQSANTVNFKVTYNGTTQLYTTWVVPNYNTPNANNTNGNEFGGTAQFTVIVPKDFVITRIFDVNGTWIKETDPSFIKLGPGQPGQTWGSLDPTLNYYVIGKSALEANYGAFSVGVPVALFSFTGNSCQGAIKALPPNHPFIHAADSIYSLNVANSFYSRSGQPAGGNQVPLEQFSNVVDSVANCLPPMPIADMTNTFRTTPVNIPVLNNDKTFDGTAATLSNVTSPSVVTSPAFGTVTVRPDGTIDYVANAGFTGTDTFTYSICDKTNLTLCSTTMVTILVTCAPKPVIALSAATVRQ
jgi:hypothetical protein